MLLFFELAFFSKSIHQNTYFLNIRHDATINTGCTYTLISYGARAGIWTRVRRVKATALPFELSSIDLDSQNRVPPSLVVLGHLWMFRICFYHSNWNERYLVTKSNNFFCAILQAQYNENFALMIVFLGPLFWRNSPTKTGLIICVSLPKV